MLAAAAESLASVWVLVLAAEETLDAWDETMVFLQEKLK